MGTTGRMQPGLTDVTPRPFVPRIPSRMEKAWERLWYREDLKADDLQWWNRHKGYSPGTEHDRVKRIETWGKARWGLK